MTMRPALALGAPGHVKTVAACGAPSARASSRRAVVLIPPLLLTTWSSGAGGAWSKPEALSSSSSNKFSIPLFQEIRQWLREVTRAATCSECPAPVSEEERRRLLAELQEYEREELRVQNEQRTRQFVDSMWQSLE